MATKRNQQWEYPYHLDEDSNPPIPRQEELALQDEYIAKGKMTVLDYSPRNAPRWRPPGEREMPSGKWDHGYQEIFEGFSREELGDLAATASLLLPQMEIAHHELPASLWKIVLKSGLAKCEMQCFKLRFKEGLKQTDIAKRLGITQPSVSILLLRARKKIKKYIQEKRKVKKIIPIKNDGSLSILSLKSRGEKIFDAA